MYVASLLFDDSMMALLAKSLQDLQKGARIISLKPIPDVETKGDVPGTLAAGGHRTLRLLHEGVFRMSWQMARVFIYLRL